MGLPDDNVFEDCSYRGSKAASSFFRASSASDAASPLLMVWAHMYNPSNSPQPPPPQSPFDDPPTREANTATVSLHGTKDVILVLSVYDAVNWTITATGGMNLQRVIVAGYHAQYVQVVGDDDDTTRIEIFDYDEGTGTLPGFSGYYPSVPDTNVGPWTVKGFREALEAYVNVPLYEYDFCYRASKLHYELP